MRRAGIIAGAVLAGLLVVVLLLPWWLGAVLRPVGARLGLTFRDYERIGYTRFALHGVEMEKAAVRVRADHVEVATPLVCYVAGRRQNQGLQVQRSMPQTMVESQTIPVTLDCRAMS